MKAFPRDPFVCTGFHRQFQPGHAKALRARNKDSFSDDIGFSDGTGGEYITQIGKLNESTWMLALQFQQTREVFVRQDQTEAVDCLR